MITEHSLRNLMVREPRDLLVTPAVLPRLRRPHVSRYAMAGLALLFELVVAAALMGASWSLGSITFGTGSYTRQGPLPPPATNAGHAAWQRHEHSLVSTGAAASPAMQLARITSQASAAATPAVAPTSAVPKPVPAPTPTRSVLLLHWPAMIRHVHNLFVGRVLPYATVARVTRTGRLWR